ncbi:MAG: tRNA (adenosine(37)-N6)-threonylcarbamoyltransferase complex dimerization subunit type 1 TsaB [Clostridia bacterium]|nr:tRNA (adenosine(37)-N6)-threonylcarbamoyltransferase complex dimerization subunit type 1 TsaB [Clostridia bacterium]
MKVLGIDTTAGVAAVAVTDGKKIISNFTLDSGNTHSATLLPMIEASLATLSLAPKDIDLISVAAGPGSFTGVRIGAASAKGIAFAHDVPCVGVSSLEAMAENLSSIPGIVCPVINARTAGVFTALFRTDGASCPERLTDDATLKTEELAEILKEYENEDIYFTGDAYEIVRDAVSLPNVKDTPVLLRRQNAAGVAALGERIYCGANDEEKAKMTADALSVIYLRKPQAEREREERLAAENNKTEE